LKANLL